ncbi:MAG: hypothetical protein AAFX79_11355 [Planctomycetota bacterium]
MPPSDAARPAAPSELDREVVDAVIGLRSAYVDLLADIPRNDAGAIGVERALGISKKLAWQVYRVATAEDPVAAGARVPGRAATRQLLAAASRAGVEAAVIDRVSAATEGFHGVVEEFADDRSTFDLMVRSVTGDGLATHDAELKRTAYRANRELAGRCCDVDVFTLLVHPGDAPGTMDFCSLRGLVGLRRLRPEVPLVVSRHRFDRGEGHVQPREAVFPEPGEGLPSGLVRPFCSEPLPAIEQHTGRDGYTRFIAQTSSLGPRSAVTCFLADRTRNLPVRSPDGAAAIGHIHEIATPARVLYQDMLVHERLLHEAAHGPIEPQLRILARRPEEIAWPGDDVGVQLPLRERTIRSASATKVLGVAELGRYRDLVAHVAGGLGWDLDRFVLLRTRVEHPVLHSLVWMRVDLEGRTGD